MEQQNEQKELEKYFNMIPSPKQLLRMLEEKDKSNEPANKYFQISLYNAYKKMFYKLVFYYICWVAVLLIFICNLYLFICKVILFESSLNASKITIIVSGQLVMAVALWKMGIKSFLEGIISNINKSVITDWRFVANSYYFAHINTLKKMAYSLLKLLIGGVVLFVCYYILSVFCERHKDSVVIDFGRYVAFYLFMIILYFLILRLVFWICELRQIKRSGTRYNGSRDLLYLELRTGGYLYLIFVSYLLENVVKGTNDMFKALVAAIALFFSLQSVWDSLNTGVQQKIIDKK